MIVLPNKGIKNQTKPKPRLSMLTADYHHPTNGHPTPKRLGHKIQSFLHQKCHTATLFNIHVTPMLSLLSSGLRRMETPLVNAVGNYRTRIQGDGTCGNYTSLHPRCDMRPVQKQSEMEARHAASHRSCPCGSAPAS